MRRCDGRPNQIFDAKLVNEGEDGVTDDGEQQYGDRARDAAVDGFLSGTTHLDSFAVGNG